MALCNYVKHVSCDNKVYALRSLQYLERFELSPSFTEEEFRHWFIPRQGIVDSYVVEVSIDTNILAIWLKCFIGRYCDL